MVDGGGQIGAPISWIAVPGEHDLFYMAQRTPDAQLILTPNEAFFPNRGVTASGVGKTEDVENLNGGKSFATIEKWNKRDVVEWGLYFEKPGNVTIRQWYSTNTNAKFSIQFRDQNKAFDAKPSGGEPLQTEPITFVVAKPGKVVLKLICDQANTQTKFHRIEITGSAATEAAVLRKRWRPAAAHTKFTSSKSSESIQLWVMEMDAVPGDLGFYSPITTPFGYYGPTWQADGTVNTGFNFSLWSFGRGKPQPPVEQLSHLLAIGNRTASFGGFDHEGTGVKIRNWEPLAGRQGQKQVLALRVEPGPKYDTYFSYFYESDRQRWRLFGVGNKYNKGKPLKSLWVGSFVEVPGPPQVQRTGPYERTMRYRGWVMNAAGKWSSLDQMTNGNVNRQTGFTHTRRGVTDDGWFFLQTGGWTFRKASQERFVRLPSSKMKRPDYLEDKDIAFLKTVPSGIDVSLTKQQTNRIEGTFHIRNIGQDAEATLFWGTEDGLTFSDRWQNQKTIRSLREGDNAFSIDRTVDDKPVFIRMLLKNSEGQFWTTQTISAKPK